MSTTAISPKNTYHTLRKVGIYLDTKGNGGLILVMRFSDGTSYWPFSHSDFLNGWAFGRLQGFQRLLDSQGCRMPDDACKAMSEFAITPCFLSTAYSNSSPNRIKWAHRRKGGWGGSRPNAGRRRLHEGQHDN